MKLPGLFTLIFFLLTGIGYSQTEVNQIAKQLLDKQKSEKVISKVEILKSAQHLSVRNSNIEDEVKEADFFMIDELETNNLLNSDSEIIEITLERKNERNLTLHLFESNIFTNEFQVFRASNKSQAYPYEKGKYYWGIVKGDYQSIASVTISNDGIKGFIYTNSETYNLGKLENEELYVLYKESDLKIENTLGCDVDDTKHLIGQKMDQSTHRVSDPNRCVQMYLEIDYDIFAQKGGVQQATDYITDVFAQVAILYANESINFAVNEILVWDVVDPYTGPSTGDYLTQFRSNLSGSFNGDLAHLVGYQGGGGVAYVDVLCNSNYGYGYSDINSTFSIVPTYSWTIEVLTHEIGHNLGSRHTHNCVWNGNNTAIDRCGPAAGYDQQACNANAPLPSAGTIMSYCHLVSGIGIDFNLGFGPQPGDLIRNRVYNSSCLVACSAPTQDDAGISNILSPSGSICTSSISPDVELTNYGTNVLSSVTINYQLDGGTVNTFSWTGSLNTGTTELVSLPSISYSLGSHTLDVYTSSPNGLSDEDGSNDLSSSTFNSQSTQTYYQDSDNDGFGNPNVSTVDCIAPNGYVSDNTDCDDTNPNIYPSASCDDGDVCTTGDVLDSNCNCVGNYSDSDNDGVCDGQDICPGGDDNADSDGDGIPDFCDCNPAVAQFSTNPLTHNGGGSSATTFTFDVDDKNVSFVISDLTSKTNGNPSTRYVDEATVSYVTGNGSSITYGVYRGDVQSTASINISGIVQSVTVSLANALNTSRALSINLSNIDYCSSQPPCQDDDNDGVCNESDVCPGFDDNLIGTSCDDGDVCTTNDVWDNTCSCTGVYSDSDGDGVCDAEDICPGGDDNADSDGDGIPDFCDNNCVITTSQFNINPLTHNGSGSTSTSLNFPSGNQDVTFTINGLSSKTNGNPNTRYIDRVTVSYLDGNGASQQYGVFDGNNVSSVSVDISGEVQSVTLTLEDGYDGNAGSTTLSVNMTDVTSCIPSGALEPGVSTINTYEVFPNPTDGQITVSFEEEIQNGDLVIYNSIGKVLKQYEINYQNSLSIDLSEFIDKSQILLISMKSDNSKPVVKKIMYLK